MREIKARQLTAESFREFGEYYDLIRPVGHTLGSFFQDHVVLPVAGGLSVGFSSLVVERADRMVVKSAEYHNHTGEILLPLEDDIIIHVAPPSVRPVPELTEAFLVPRGTMVKLNVGVWHLAPFSASKAPSHVLVALPERTYFSDCTVVDYGPDQCVEIIR
jgi:ureidoglycolate lyase